MYIKDDIEFKYTKKIKQTSNADVKKKNNNNNTKLHKRKINYCKKNSTFENFKTVFTTKQTKMYGGWGVEVLSKLKNT